MVIGAFQVFNKLGRFWFFWKIFLVADISIKGVLGMFFLIFNNVNI